MQDKQPASATPSTRRQFLVQGTALAAVSVAAPHAFAADDVIKIGYLTHRTGPFAPFAEADSFILDNATKALAGGLNIGGKKYRVEFIAKDDQSSGNKNVSKMRVVGGQWVIDEKGKLDIVVTHNGTAPEIPVQRKFVLLGA